LQESLEVIKMAQQEGSLRGSSRNTESAYDDATSPQKPGMLERMRTSMFWASPDPKA